MQLLISKDKPSQHGWSCGLMIDSSKQKQFDDAIEFAVKWKKKATIRANVAIIGPSMQ